jgi:hypothetical protein
MTDGQILAKATIAAALIETRVIDPQGLASSNKDISHNKLTHLRELTERILNALSTESEGDRH